MALNKILMFFIVVKGVYSPPKGGYISPLYTYKFLWLFVLILNYFCNSIFFIKFVA